MALKKLTYFVNNSFVTKPMKDRTSLLSQQTNKEVKPILISDDNLKKFSDVETNLSTQSITINNISAFSKKGFGSDVQGNGDSGQPYVKRKIGEVWGNGTDLLQGRIKTDEKRIESFLNSAKGKTFLSTQVSLQLMNPATDSIGELRFNRMFNPISIQAAVAGWQFGYHPERHGFFGTTPDYEATVKLKNADALNMESLPFMLTGNRLVSMFKERQTGIGAMNPLNLTLSKWGGPNSLGGIGATLFFKTTDGIPFTNKDKNKLLTDSNSFKNLDLNKKIQFTKFYDNKNPYETIKGNSNQSADISMTAQTSTQSDGRLISILKASNESKTFPGWKMNYAINKDLKQYIEEDVYSKANYYEINPKRDVILQQTAQSKISEIGITRGTSNEVKEKSNLINAFEQAKKDNPKWNGDGNAEKSINYNEINAAGGFSVFDSTVLNEVEAYNTTNGFEALKELGSNSTNRRGAVQRVISVSTPGWSNVGKYYKSKLGEAYVDSMHDTVNGTSPMIPDIGDLDRILLLERDINKYDGVSDSSDAIGNDFIDFVVCGIQFRATLDGLAYNFTPNWSDISYVGRSDVLHLYGGMSREISFNFIIAALSKDEMDMIYYKLNQLARKISPAVKDNRMVAPISTLTIGKIVKDEFGFLSSLSYAFDDSFPWDIDDYKMPMAVKVSCNWTIIGRESPTNETYYFDRVIREDINENNQRTRKYSDGTTKIDNNQ